MSNEGLIYNVPILPNNNMLKNFDIFQQIFLNKKMLIKTCFKLSTYSTYFLEEYFSVKHHINTFFLTKVNNFLDFDEYLSNLNLNLTFLIITFLKFHYYVNDIMLRNLLKIIKVAMIKVKN